MLESVRKIHGHTRGSQPSKRARNRRRREMVSIQSSSCETRQKLGNLQSQTGNFVAQQSWATKLQQTLLRVWHRPKSSV